MGIIQLALTLSNGVETMLNQHFQHKPLMRKVGFGQDLHSRRQFLRRSITFDQFNLMSLIIECALIIEYAPINGRANHDNVASFKILIGAILQFLL